MAQFQVYRLAEGELVIDCQADELSALPSRFVVPLLDLELVPNPVRGLHPTLLVDDCAMVLATHAASAVSRSKLGKPLQSLEHQRYTILNALDFLITGV